MRILYVSNEYPPETGFGGIATYTKNMAGGMSSLGHDIHVICRSSSGKVSTVRDGTVTVHRISPGQHPLPPAKAFYLFRKACRRIIPHSLERLAWAREACKTFEMISSSEGGFDVVEYPDCGGEGFYIAGTKKTRLAARLHTPWNLVASLDCISENPVEKTLLSHLDRAPVRSAHAVSCPTFDLAGRVKKLWRLKSVDVFPNPIPTNEYPKSTGGGWIYTGRVERRKGVHVLIQAYAILAKKITPPPLRIVGRPYGTMNGMPFGDHIEGLIEKNNLAGSIEWIRGVDHESVKQLLSRSSVAIFPSLWENLSYSCLEAMACGCAVVATSCGGFSEIIRHRENGYLAAPGNPDDLAAVLYELHHGRSGDPKAIGAAGRETVRATCDSSIVCKTAERWYASLCDRVRI
jgi:glycogen(starch) synthase